VFDAARPAPKGCAWLSCGPDHRDDPGRNTLRVVPSADADTATTRRWKPAEHTAAQARIINAALGLFAEHGVGGTSLQMIAGAIGVSKAAVYHQFPTKDEIVLAAAEAELARVDALIDAAEAEPDPERAREVLLEQMVDLAVERRRMERSMLGDPVVAGMFAKRKSFRRVVDQVMNRLYRVLMGDDTEPTARVPAAMLTAAISGAVMHPLAAEVDDETLRTQLLQMARRFLDLPE
jgi:AcrR family transcriptional regulator